MADPIKSVDKLIEMRLHDAIENGLNAFYAMIMLDGATQDGVMPEEGVAYVARKAAQQAAHDALLAGDSPLIGRDRFGTKAIDIAWAIHDGAIS